jgi:hypothetical protein
MPYTIDVFMNWPSFGSWTDLHNWLSSNEGGSLRVVEPRNSPYALVRYVKGQSNFALPHVAWCRSVVVDKATRLPVCIAPPKASELTDSTAMDAMVAEEFLDGTMINIFDGGSADQAFLATRSRLNADTKFYENRSSFAEMMQDALTAQGVASLSNLLVKDANRNSFTSVVLQHPTNRIVHTTQVATFMILQQGYVASDGRVTIEEDSSRFQYVTTNNVACHTASRYSLDQVRAAKTIPSWVAEQSQKLGFSWQGVVLKDGTGRRWRVRSEVYETIRSIRGNEATSEERFARLRKSRSVEQYLAFFSEDRDLMYTLEGRFRKNTRQLFQFYTDVFRSRTSKYYELPWPYKHHVSVLHTMFKDILRPQGKKVDMQEVIRYINSLSLEDTFNMAKEHTLLPSKSRVIPTTSEQESPSVPPATPMVEVTA